MFGTTIVVYRTSWRRFSASPTRVIMLDRSVQGIIAEGRPADLRRTVSTRAWRSFSVAAICCPSHEFNRSEASATGVGRGLSPTCRA